MLQAALKAAVCAAVMLSAVSAAAAPAKPTAPVAQSQDGASADGRDRHVTIRNRTGWTMLSFYASDASTDDWEEDILGEDVLENRQNVRINIDDGSGACEYDFKAEFTNGEELTRFGVNVCEVSEYTFSR
jgi:hypothetical protein